MRIKTRLLLSTAFGRLNAHILKADMWLLSLGFWRESPNDVPVRQTKEAVQAIGDHFTKYRARLIEMASRASAFRYLAPGAQPSPA
jgi:hypothetical protein